MFENIKTPGKVAHCMQEKQSCRGNFFSAEETEKCNYAKRLLLVTCMKAEEEKEEQCQLCMLTGDNRRLGGLVT